MEINEISITQFDDFIQKVSVNSFLQTSQMSNVLEASNIQTKLLGLIDGGEIVAVALAVIRKVFLGTRIDLMTGAISIEPENEYIFMIN